MGDWKYISMHSWPLHCLHMSGHAHCICSVHVLVLWVFHVRGIASPSHIPRLGGAGALILCCLCHRWVVFTYVVRPSSGHIFCRGLFPKRKFPVLRRWNIPGAIPVTSKRVFCNQSLLRKKKKHKRGTCIRPLACYWFCHEVLRYTK
jgi:hypothetical protein